MSRTPTEYFSDDDFQLEVNIFYIQRQLIKLLEEDSLKNDPPNNPDGPSTSNGLNGPRRLDDADDSDDSESPADSDGADSSDGSDSPESSEGPDSTDEPDNINDLRSLSSTMTSYTSSETTSEYRHERDRSMDIFYNVAPPAESLPMPKWAENIATARPRNETNERESSISVAYVNNWIRASVPFIRHSNTEVILPNYNNANQEVNYTWPPVSDSIWSRERLSITLFRQHLYDEISDAFFNGNRNRNGWEDFFRHLSRDELISSPASIF